MTTDLARTSGAPRWGHTGITWPFTPAGAQQAIADVAAAGFAGIELFGFVLDEYPGGLDAVGTDLEAVGLRYVASYCSVSLVDPAKRGADLASMARWAGQVAALGGDVVVVGPDQRTREDYDQLDYARIARTLGEIGRLTADLGVATCFHPHTLTPVESRDAIAQVMDIVDPSVVFMAPDTGQIAKGGADPVEVVATYRERIRHLHLKDYAGGVSRVDWDGSHHDRTGYLDYTPLGEGVVDVPAILATLGAGYPGWVMVELDGTEHSPHPAAEAALISKRYLDTIGEGAAR